MKFRCERDDLAEALGVASRAASNRAGQASVLAGVRLDVTGDRLTVTGTDTELTIAVDEEVTTDVEGSTVLPGARLATEIVRSLEPGRVDVEAGSDEVRIASGRSEYRLRSRASDDFPRLALPASEPNDLDAAAFGEALDQVVRAASSDESRAILTGVLLAAEADGLRLVATDSYRLAVRDVPSGGVLVEGQKVLVPGRALKELQRLLGGESTLAVQLGERDATFLVGAKRLTTRLIEGEFPNYRQLIPQAYPNKLWVGREAILDAIRRLKPLASASDATPIRLSMSSDGLHLDVSSQELGHAQEELDAKYEGTEMTVAFNVDYLAQGADAAVGGEIVIETQDALKPAVLRSAERTDFLYLLMPVRVP